MGFIIGFLCGALFFLLFTNFAAQKIASAIQNASKTEEEKDDDDENWLSDDPNWWKK